MTVCCHVHPALNILWFFLSFTIVCSMMVELCLRALKFYWSVLQIVYIVSEIPYILESNPHLNLMRTSFCRFLKRKKKVSLRF